MTRRELIAAGSAAATMSAAPTIPIIDTHIHLFDISRKQGVPWPPKDSPIYKSAMPPRYRELVKGLNVVGAIELECSPWFDDNQWVLDVMKDEKIMVGMIGNLEPDKPGFGKQLEKLRENKLYLGIRYGNIWDRDLAKMVDNPRFIDGVKLLAQAGLTLDSANPSPSLLDTLLRLSDKVPDLRIVADHLPRMDNPPAAALKALAARPNVYAKVSGVPRRVDGKVPTDPTFYRSRLDVLYDAFGPDKVIYGSDWPNSDHWADYRAGLAIVTAYFTNKGQAVAEKYFWRNSVKAYRWVKRDASQPS